MHTHKWQTISPIVRTRTEKRYDPSMGNKTYFLTRVYTVRVNVWNFGAVTKFHFTLYIMFVAIFSVKSRCQ